MSDQQKEQEAVNKVYNYAAALMVQQKKSPDQAKNELINQGLDDESASIVVDNLLKDITRAKKERANKDMLYGALWCIGGIIATVANIGFIFWGAILFGAIQFIKGAINSQG